MYRLDMTRGHLNVVWLIVVSCYPGTIVAQPMGAVVEGFLLSK
jgi:hypothetical protein